jgi:hypothetical protein
MAGVALGDFFMAACTRRVADIMDVGIDVPVGANISPPWVGWLRRRGRREFGADGGRPARQPGARKPQASQQEQSRHQKKGASLRPALNGWRFACHEGLLGKESGVRNQESGIRSQES